MRENPTVLFRLLDSVPFFLFPFCQFQMLRKHKDWHLPFKMPGMEHSTMSEKEPWFLVQTGTSIKKKV